MLTAGAKCVCANIVCVCVCVCITNLYPKTTSIYYHLQFLGSKTQEQVLVLGSL